MKKWKLFKHRIFGIRQVDDLIFWVAYNRRKNYTKDQATDIILDMLEPGRTYRGGLELEEQTYIRLDKDTTQHEFAGTVITVVQKERRELEISCKPLNKNKDSIYQKGKQQIPRFIHVDSSVPEHYKLGTQITTYLRLCEQSSTDDILIEAMKDNFYEMTALGYDINFFVKALCHLAFRERVEQTSDKIHSLYLADLVKAHSSSESGQ